MSAILNLGPLPIPLQSFYIFTNHVCSTPATTHVDAYVYICLVYLKSTCHGLCCSLTQSMGTDKDSGYGLDLYPHCIRQHGHLLDASTHMRLELTRMRWLNYFDFFRISINLFPVCTKFMYMYKPEYGSSCH